MAHTKDFKTAREVLLQQAFEIPQIPEGVEFQNLSYDELCEFLLCDPLSPEEYEPDFNACVQKLADLMARQDDDQDEICGYCQPGDQFCPSPDCPYNREV